MKKNKLKVLSLLTSATLLISGFSECSAATDSSEISEICAQYSADDTNSSWNQSSATDIVLNGDSISVNGIGASADGSILTITDAGTYVLSGTLSDGQIVVDAEKSDTVRIVLNKAQISNSESSAIYAKQSEKMIITLADGTENKVSDAESYVYENDEDEPNAAIFSKDDITINGSGSLKVSGNFNNGIASKDSLVVTGGDITVNSVNDAIRGRDYIAIKDGTFTITAGGDGLQSNNDEDEEKGWICIDGGTFSITSANDGVQAETTLQINGAFATLVTGGGSSSAIFDTEGEMNHGFGGSNPPDSPKPEFQKPGDVNPEDSSNESKASEDSASAKALKAGTAIIIKSGELSIDSYDDALHSNGNMLVESGNISISSGDDGMHADSSLVVDGGSISISKCYEGLEGASITVNGGTIDVKSASGYKLSTPLKMEFTAK